MWYINNKHAPCLRKAKKDQNIKKGPKKKNIVPLRSNINLDFINWFSKTKQNLKVVSGFGKCLCLLEN